MQHAVAATDSAVTRPAQPQNHLGPSLLGTTDRYVCPFGFVCNAFRQTHL